MMPEPHTGAGMPDALAQIRRSFLARLGDRCLAIDAVLERNAGAVIDRDGRDLIVHHAHKTAGVAASLGFAELGRLARLVEAAWESGPATAADLRQALDITHGFLDEIERILDEDLNA